jgi:hypothetical protein
MPGEGEGRMPGEGKDANARWGGTQSPVRGRTERLAGDSVIIIITYNKSMWWLTGKILQTIICYISLLLFYEAVHLGYTLCVLRWFAEVVMGAQWCGGWWGVGWRCACWGGWWDFLMEFYGKGCDGIELARDAWYAALCAAAAAVPEPPIHHRNYPNPRRIPPLRIITRCPSPSPTIPITRHPLPPTPPHECPGRVMFRKPGVEEGTNARPTGKGPKARWGGRAKCPPKW